MENHWLVFVDTRKTCVNLGAHDTRPLNIFCFYSGRREKCDLVRRSTTHSGFVKLMILTQFLNHRRYHGPEQRWEGVGGLLLLRLQGR